MKASVNNSTCLVAARERLTRGTVGKTMEAEFSADWDGLAITAVFEAGDVKKDVVYTGEPIIIPHEVLDTAGVSVMLGFHGALPDGTIVKRTAKEWINNVSETLDPAGVPSTEPTPDWTAQVQAIATEAKEVADSVRSDADAGKFNGQAGADGGWYTPAVTQPNANTMRVAFTPSKEGMPEVTPKDITIPGGGGITVDDTLTVSGVAADAKAVGDAINSLSEEIANLQTSGLTTAQVNALDGMFKVAAYIKADVSAEYSAFKTAFGIEDSGGTEPEKTLTSISATYSGGDVAVGTAVTDLTGIVVTAHYSDGSTAEVTGYALSGTIVEGSNTITVSYNGKTATFTVTGVADTTGDDTGKNLLYSWDFTKSLTDSLSGEIATLNGSATQGSDGVHLTALTDYIGLGGLVTAVNRAYELDMGSMERSGTAHGRLLIHDGTAGFMYRNSGYWTWWSAPGWCDSTGLTAFDDIANKTIRIEVDASGYQTLYVDGNQVATSSLVVGGSAGNKGYEGYSITIGSSAGSSAAISTIKAFRVYNLGGA